MSDFYNKYPYTDFHELNLDWVIERVKKLTEDWLTTHEEWVEVQQDWADTEQAWIDFKAYVENYLANLDVQDEIDHKIDQMVADGSLRNLIRPDVLSQTISTTTDWLDDHITQPTTPAIDTSLTIQGAAADAESAGSHIRENTANLSKYAINTENNTSMVESVDFDITGYVLPDGSFSTGGGGSWMRSTYIAIDGINFIIANLNYNDAVSVVYFYDDAKTPISKYTQAYRDSVNHSVIIPAQEFPANTKYIVMTARVDSYGTGYYALISRGVTFKESLSYIWDEYLSINASFTNNKYITTTGGISNSTDPWKVAVISLKNIDFIIANFSTDNNAVLNVAYYDDTDTFISGFRTVGNVFISRQDIPINAEIMKCTGYSNDDIVYYYKSMPFNRNRIKKSIPLSIGGYRRPDGSFSPTANTWISSEILPLNNIDQIFFSGERNSVVANISFFDIDMTFIPDSVIQCPSLLQDGIILNRNDFPANAEYFQVSGSTSIGFLDIVINGSLLNKTIWCFGDSITSDEVCGIGNKIAAQLGLNIINFAHGNATCSDYYTGNTDITIESPTVDYVPGNPSAVANEKNVLSNQVRRALCQGTNIGDAVSYTHPIAGNYSLDPLIWTGTGSNNTSPDIIYIAIGINDGGAHTGDSAPYVDDSAAVIEENYADLNRKTISSALRWAIETLQSKFPKADIFVADTLCTGANVTSRLRWYTCNKKRTSIMNISNFCCAHFIDQLYESNFSTIVATSPAGSSDGIHPSDRWRYLIAKYLSKQIEDTARHNEISMS